jgi:hypothetical protein
MAAHRKESLSLGVSIPLSDLLSLGQSPREGEKSYEPNQIERRLYDGRKNDVADSSAYLVATSLTIVFGKLPSPSHLDQVTRMFNYHLANNPYFVTMTPLDKQKLYESDIISAGFLAVLFQQDDLEMQELAKQWAREFLKQRLP